MLIDCDRCEMRDIACTDCVVGVLITAGDLQSADRRMPPGTPSARPGASGADRVGPAAGRGARATGRGPGITDRGGPSRNRRADAADKSQPGAAPSGEAAAAAAAEPPGAPGPEIGEPERRALHTLAAAGLVPPLRLVLPDPDRDAPTREFPDAEAS